jgi:hypothetical protein
VDSLVDKRISGVEHCREEPSEDEKPGGLTQQAAVSNDGLSFDSLHFVTGLQSSRDRLGCSGGGEGRLRQQSGGG